MQKHLITGGAGFIGSHLADALIARGDEVAVLDDLSTGSMANLVRHEGNPRFRFVDGSAADPSAVAPLVDWADQVFHLAAAVGVQLVFQRPTHTIQTNIRGAEVVLEQCARFGRKVFIASTSEVYGKGVRIPLSETDDLLLGPTTCARWSYACSKAIDEFLALAYFKEQGLPVVIARFFNTVGPRQTGRYGMVIPRFVGQALRGEPITVYGTGRQTRCFTHVGDVVRGVIALMEEPRALGEVFNIGNDREISVLDLAMTVIGRTGGKSEVRLVPFEDAFGPGFEDMDRRVPNLAKIRSVIEWDNLRDIGEILDGVIESMG